MYSENVSGLKFVFWTGDLDRCPSGCHWKTPVDKQGLTDNSRTNHERKRKILIQILEVWSKCRIFSTSGIFLRQISCLFLVLVFYFLPNIVNMQMWTSIPDADFFLIPKGVLTNVNKNKNQVCRRRKKLLLSYQHSSEKINDCVGVDCVQGDLLLEGWRTVADVSSC